MLSAQQEQPLVPLDQALEMAQGHHRSGNLILAERTYRDILRAVPDHYPTTQFLAGVLYQTGNFDEARYYFERAIEAEPEDANCLNNYGGILVQLKDYDRALIFLNKALEISPDYIDAMNNKAYLLWLMEDYKGAEKLSREVLDIDEENTIALNGLAIALSRLYRYEEALDIWESATEKDPKNVQLWSNWCNALREMSRLKQAKEKGEEAIKLSPKNPEALNNLANAIRDLGDIEKAIEYYTQATDQMPSYAEAHYNRATAYHDNNQIDAAIVSAKYALAFKPNFSKAFSLLSQAYSSNGDYSNAHDAAQRALHYADPEDADPYIVLSDTLSRLDRFDDAMAALDEALKREPDSARAYLKLSDVYESLHKPDEAHAVIDKALNLSPDMPRLYARKGMIFHMESKKDQALEHLDKAINLAPAWMVPYQQKAEVLLSNNEEAAGEEMLRQAMKVAPNFPGPHIMMAGFKKYKGEDDPDFIALKSHEDTIKTRGKDIEINYYFALADAYENLGKHDESFSYLEKAASLKRYISPISEIEDGLANKMERRRRLYNKDFIDQMYGNHGCKSETPIFICGMPRSGTTLTEQILASHPDVFGAGELPYISEISFYLADKREVTPALFTELGEEYVRRIKAKDTSGKSKYVTDKMPGNAMNLGLIVSALPNAKIIHCRRNPIDTCLSCYKQNFANGHYWSYDLEEMGDYYLEYLKMVEHWRDTLPEGKMLEIDYEDTVNNFEEQARKLIDYVGLEWNDACLEPHKQKRSILTASRSQVTQPVYKTSVEKWRKYEKHLQPLVRKLLPDQALPEEESA